nr:hypothetical protein [Kibdelosporangium sp. MJ126-NF4]CTQ91000.1 hypothetical protein [Kibdelosporangium sp. MJ126-NF4]
MSIWFNDMRFSLSARAWPDIDTTAEPYRPPLQPEHQPIG